jgi:tetratricopeptide (TPR) repeat protein
MLAGRDKRLTMWSLRQRDDKAAPGPGLSVSGRSAPDLPVSALSKFDLIAPDTSVRNDSLPASALPGRKRNWTFWIGRALLIGAAAGFIVLGILWWRDRPLAEAEASLKKGDARYAHFLLAKFLDRYPHHQRATALQAQVHVAMGEADTAIALFEQAGTATHEDERALTRALLMTEQWTLAIPLLERAVQQDADNADALYELTACRVRLGLFEQALESAQRFARLPGQEARGHVFVGAILRDLGKDVEAATAYQTVLKYDPTAGSLQSDPADFFLQYGQTLLRLGKPEESLEPLKRSAAARESPEVLLELGNAAMQLQRVNDAKAAWKRAVALDDRYVAAREALAGVELAQGQAEQALQWLAPLGEEQVTLESAYLRQRAATLLGETAEAERWQQLASKLRKQQEFSAEIDQLMAGSPQSFWARVIRTHRFAEQGNWRQAALLVEVLLQEAPTEPFVIELAAAVHRRRDLPSLQSLPITHF